MAQDNLPTFVFYRTGEIIYRNNAVSGHRGVLIAGGRLYFTIERDVDTYVKIPAGVFTLKMEDSPTKKINDSPRKQFRIKGHNVPREEGGLANLLVHQGRYPHTLKGCIAPGKTKIEGGIDQSSTAMQELFDICGKFKPGKEAAVLQVIYKPVFWDPIGVMPTF
jgi:hypothetical protein